MQLLLLHKTIFPQHLQCIDTMKKFFCFIYLTCLMLPTSAQGILSLDSCRALAVANNKELLISREKINAAHYRKKEAFTNYLPKISATGGYMRNQKEFSLLNDAQKGTLGSVGTQVSGALQNGIQGMMTQYPQLAQNPQFMALVQSLGNIDIATPLNGLGQSLVDAFRTDTRNMYAGALTLTQPLYMGGKIRAYNKITRYAEELARQQHNSGMQEVILSTDQAYWQVVSLANKKKLAEGYLEMNSVYATRPEVRSLELAAQIYKQKVNVTRSEFLPSVALIGNYMATNPSVFNSFENKFKGMWNVGVMVSIPVWHWGEGIYKVKAAKSEARISRYQLDDAKEKIELQVSQSVFKVNEAAKKLIMAEKNLEKADENLRYATLGFEEGVIPASNVLEAHTAWLSAQSEKIDAQIDVKLTEIYLKKATGSLNIEN